jgi:hypothetical protein
MTMRSFVASPTGIGTGRRKIFFCPRPFRELGIIKEPLNKGPARG